MRNHVLCSALAATAFLCAVANLPAADPPAPSPEQQVLDRLLGSWRTDYKTQKAEWTPAEKQFSAELTSTRILGGTFVQEKGQHPEKVSSLTLYTYDTDRNCYRAWWFSSTGQTSESTGQWDADARTLTWTATTGAPYISTARHRFVNDDTVESHGREKHPDQGPEEVKAGGTARSGWSCPLPEHVLGAHLGILVGDGGEQRRPGAEIA
jgi:hypothetical protein